MLICSGSTGFPFHLLNFKLCFQKPKIEHGKGKNKGNACRMYIPCQTLWTFYLDPYVPSWARKGTVE